jgi:hypothetical protein
MFIIDLLTLHVASSLSRRQAHSLAVIMMLAANIGLSIHLLIILNSNLVDPNRWDHPVFYGVLVLLLLEFHDGLFFIVLSIALNNLLVLLPVVIFGGGLHEVVHLTILVI